MSKAYAIWLSGSSFYRKQILDKIFSSISEGYIIHRVGSYSNANELELKMLSMDMFNDKTEIFLFDSIPCFSSDEKKSFAKLAYIVEKTASSSKMYIFNNCDENKPILKVIDGSIGKRFEQDLYFKKEESLGFIRDYFENNLKTIDIDFVKLILDNCIEYPRKGYMVDELHLACLRIIILMEKRKIVTKEDVHILSDIKKDDIWELFKFIEKGDITNSLKFYNEEKNKDGLEATVNKLYSICNWRFRLLSMIKSSMLKEKNKKQIYEEVKLIKKNGKEGEIQYWNDFIIYSNIDYMINHGNAKYEIKDLVILNELLNLSVFCARLNVGMDFADLCIKLFLDKACNPKSQINYSAIIKNITDTTEWSIL